MLEESSSEFLSIIFVHSHLGFRATRGLRPRRSIREVINPDPHGLLGGGGGGF